MSEGGQKSTKNALQATYMEARQWFKNTGQKQAQELSRELTQSQQILENIGLEVGARIKLDQENMKANNQRKEKIKQEENQHTNDTPSEASRIQQHRPAS